MVQQWNFRQELVFCFGHHLADNPTQHMLEKAFRHHGMNWRYVNFELGNERLAEAVRAVRGLGLSRRQLHHALQGQRDPPSGPPGPIRGPDGGRQLRGGGTAGRWWARTPTARGFCSRCGR